MPYESTFAANKNVLICRGWGKVTANEIAAEIARNSQDPGRLRDRKCYILDFSDAETLQLSAADIQGFVSVESSRSHLVPKLHVVVIAPRDSVFGLLREWESLAYRLHWEIEVFRTWRDAEPVLRARYPDFAESLLTELGLSVDKQR